MTNKTISRILLTVMLILIAAAAINTAYSTNRGAKTSKPQESARVRKTVDPVIKWTELTAQKDYIGNKEDIAPQQVVKAPEKVIETPVEVVPPKPPAPTPAPAPRPTPRPTPPVDNVCTTQEIEAEATAMWCGDEPGEVFTYECVNGVVIGNCDFDISLLPIPDPTPDPIPDPTPEPPNEYHSSDCLNRTVNYNGINRNTFTSPIDGWKRITQKMICDGAHGAHGAVDYISEYDYINGDDCTYSNYHYTCTPHDIIASAPGTVYETGTDRAGGNYVVLKHIIGSRTLYTFYLHMEDNSIPVSAGQSVYRGQKLGVMGNTGISSGTHLHFSIYDESFNGQKDCRVDWGSSTFCYDPLWFTLN